jgi:phage terminase large subunit-like protein
MAKIPSSPSKLPPNYVDRVVKRLLPPADVINSLSGQALIELYQRKQSLSTLVRLDPGRFFLPHETGQQKQFMMELDNPDSSAIVLAMLSGNKGGKSTAGAITFGEFLIGKPIWGHEFREFSRPTPIRAAIFAEDFESHSETILPNLQTWLPHNSIRHVQRTSMGHPIATLLANNSVIHHKTFEQGSPSAEGKDWDIVWIDEPPPRSIYSAVFRGLVARNGKLLITATLLKEVWLYDELQQPYVKGFFSSIHDNSWLNAYTKQAFLDSLSDGERETREIGTPMELTGLVYKEFKNAEPYVIPATKLPDNVPYFVGIDPHERKPVFALYGYIAPNDEITFVGYAFGGPGSTEKVIRDLRSWEAENLPVQPRLCIIDPQRAKARQLGDVSWEEVFCNADYQVVLGQNDVSIGHSMVHNYLTINPITNRPKMRFMDSCDGRGGPIHYMLRYSWDDWHRNIQHTKDVKEKPKDTFKDFPDIIRYIAMEELSYNDLHYGVEAVSYLNPNGRIPGVNLHARIDSHVQ